MTEDHVPDRLLPRDVEEHLSAALWRIAGLMAIATLLLAWTALLSWSSSDPGLINVTRDAPRNMLGHAGALTSDVLMQALGLAAVLVLLVATLWAASLALVGRVFRIRLKAAGLPFAVLLLAGALSSLPKPPIWPLDPGFGGVVGDGVYRFAFAIVAGIAPDRAGLFAGLILFALGASAATQVLLADARDVMAAWRMRRGRAPHDDRQRGSAGAARRPVEASLPRASADVEDVLVLARAAPGAAIPDIALPGGAVAAAVAASRPAHAGPAAQLSAEPVRVPATSTRALDHAYGRHATQVPPPPRWQLPAGSTPYPVAEESVSLDAGENDFGPLEDDGDDGHREFAERFAPGGKKRTAKPRKPAPSRPARQDSGEVATLSARPEDRIGGAARGRSGISAPKSTPPAQRHGQRTAQRPAEGMPIVADEETYHRPSLNLLTSCEPIPAAASAGPAIAPPDDRKLLAVLEHFGVRAVMRSLRPGPVITVYEIEVAPGTRIGRVAGLADDIARALGSPAARVVERDGRNVIAIELANSERRPVPLRELIEGPILRAAERGDTLPIVCGRATGGEAAIVDLARLPHLLVVGGPGSDSGSLIDAALLSLVYRHGPTSCRLLLSGTRQRRLQAYRGIPHLAAPVIADAQKAVAALAWVAEELDERSKRMAQLPASNIELFNNRVRNARRIGTLPSRVVQTGFDRRTGKAIREREQLDFLPMPYLVVVIDEIADLMAVDAGAFERLLERLSQKARAAGIHLLMATEHASPSVVTAGVKAHVPTRLCLRVASKAESKAVLDAPGAERLLAEGDMLMTIGTQAPVRLTAGTVAAEDVRAVADYLGTLPGPGYVPALARLIG
ncbi:MAG: DNA translocase FtsK 4TM domain-containing protein [Hyphomicrobiaceae bacterium]|nr:DNA translocase FtsK 4TM domain-containing protein [Hyphomicrobiaceae bacterium]